MFYKLDFCIIVACIQDQKPFNARAMEVDLAHSRKLNEEAKSIDKVDYIPGS